MLVQKMTLLNHCWVCGRIFSHSLKQEDHHVIPRAYGGTDGPQVSLCSDHHTALHEIALKLWTKKPYFHLLTREPEQDKKLMYLATVAYNARVATDKDPNKRRLILYMPSKATMDKIDRLKSLHGTRMSRETVLNLAIDTLFSRHFIK